MNILLKSKSKNQIIKNIEEAGVILTKIKTYIIPANNIYWCNQLDLQRSSNDDLYFGEFNKNVTTILTLIKQFEELYYTNSKLCLDCPKQKEFSEDYFKRSLKSLYCEISTTSSGIKKLTNYNSNKELKKTAKLLDIILGNINSSLDNISTEQKLEKGL